MRGIDKPTVSHKSDYTPHISANILVYLRDNRSQCAACIAVYIYCSLEITQHKAIIVKTSGNKSKYTTP